MKGRASRGEGQGRGVFRSTAPTWFANIHHEIEFDTDEVPPSFIGPLPVKNVGPSLGRAGRTRAMDCNRTAIRQQGPSSVHLRPYRAVMRANMAPGLNGARGSQFQGRRASSFLFQTGQTGPKLLAITKSKGVQAGIDKAWWKADEQGVAAADPK